MDKKKIVIIAVSVLALTGIGVGIYFWNKKRTQSESDSSGEAEESDSSGGSEKSDSNRGSGLSDEAYIKNELEPYGQATIDFGNSVLEKMNDSEKKIWADRIRSKKRSAEFEVLSKKYGIN